MTNSIIEPGSRDIEEVNLRLGVVRTYPVNQLIDAYSTNGQRGNKFIIAEHFVDESGTPVPEDVFDFRKMCYSMFVAPIPDRGRHRTIAARLSYDNPEYKTGRVVGGGRVRLSPEHKLELDDFSGDYRQEPNYLRNKFGQLLRELLSYEFNMPDMELNNCSQRFYSYATNPYWLAYEQVLKEAQEEANKPKSFIDLKVELEQFKNLKLS